MSSNADNSASSSDEQPSFWDAALEGAANLGTGLDADEGVDPIGLPADSETAAEQAPTDANEASTTPTGTDATATNETSAKDIESGLEDVPEEFRHIVEAAISQKEKDLQSGFTAKFQALAEERKNAEALQMFATESGLDSDAIMQYAAAFKQLQETPGVRITQGDQVVYEAEGGHEEPDFDLMTKAEIVAHLRKENEQAAQALVQQVQTSVAPLQQQHADSNAVALGQAWRASHSDASDDVMNIAVAKAQEFTKRFPGTDSGLDSVDALETFMTPFLAQAKALKASATTTPPSSPPAIDVPRKSTKAPKRNRKGMSLEQMAEDVARDKGYSSLADAARAFNAAD